MSAYRQQRLPMDNLGKLFNTIGVSFIGALKSSLNSSTIQVFNTIAPALRANSKHASRLDSGIVTRIHGLGLMLATKKVPKGVSRHTQKEIKVIRQKNAEKRDSFEKLVGLYSDIDFKIHFRLNRRSAEIIFRLVGPYVKEGTRRPAIKCHKMVLLALWILGNQESFKGVADRFKMGKGHAHRVFFTFCTILGKRAHEVITWPESQEALETVQKFNELRIYSFPNVVGCVDATHIPIRSPDRESVSFCNPCGYHSTILQGVCDSESRFIDVFCGWPGSSNYSNVWKNSPIYKDIKEGKRTIPTNCHLLGNSSYPLDSFLMVPFRNDECLSDLEQNFNDELMSTRAVIDHAFSILKGRFRRLKFLDMILIDKIPSVVLAACVLHNICIDNKDVTLERGEETQEIVDYDEEFTQSGLERRDAVASYMFEENLLDGDLSD